MANVKTYVVTCTLANTAYNVLTGTTVAPTGPTNYVDKGCEITFQNQGSNSSAIIEVGGSDVVTLGGIELNGRSAAYTVGKKSSSSGIQASDWWVTSDIAGQVVVVQLIKSV
jgi:hypothetical protein